MDNKEVYHHQKDVANPHFLILFDDQERHVSCLKQ